MKIKNASGVLGRLDTENPRYAYSEKVDKQATIVPMIFIQTKEYATASMTMGGFSKYKKNGTY